MFSFLGLTKEVLKAKPKVFPWCTPEAERQVLPPCEGFPSGETPTDSIDVPRARPWAPPSRVTGCLLPALSPALPAGC